MREKQYMKPIALGDTGVTVAENVAKLKEAHGLTFASLSDDTGIPTLGLRRIVAQARKVSVDDLVALSAAFCIAPEVLLGKIVVSTEVSVVTKLAKLQEA